MAKESVNILKDKIDIVDLLAQLNAALSEEWLAFYQYWVGSFVVEGAMRGDVTYLISVFLVSIITK